VRNEEVLHIVKEKGNVLHTLKRNENLHIKVTAKYLTFIFALNTYLLKEDEV